ncbi:MAG: hypothetical protein WC570_04220 [Patescibacteria group bacterium]
MQKITAAVQQKNIEKLISTLQDVNQLLTGLNLGDFATGASREHLKEELHKFFQESQSGREANTVVYLGDGGLSRLLIAVDEDGKVTIEPTYNSTDEVKKNWKLLQ